MSLVALSAIFGWWALLVAGLAGEAVGVGLIAGVAVAWSGSQLHRTFSTAHGQVVSIRESAEEAERHCLDVFNIMIGFVEGRDRYWKGHSDNVGRLAEQIARQLGLSDQRCHQLKLAGHLHDVGLLAVPEAMLNKDAKLGLEAFRHVTEHAEISYELLKPLDSMQPVLDDVRYHHERMNGTGYPKGLTGEAIPLGARILAVADSFDAMTHDRPQRHAMTTVQAMSELQRCAPAGYDPNVVDALGKVLNMDVITEGSATRPMGAVA
ncbi:MAG: HD-GYP domain-containing protein [Planctomycetota bacterium]|jgi:HD-GYP domain-containing protein (c-di-GMP phosphodiesterase class II)